MRSSTSRRGASPSCEKAVDSRSGLLNGRTRYGQGSEDTLGMQGAFAQLSSTALTQLKDPNSLETLYARRAVDAGEFSCKAQGQ